MAKNEEKKDITGLDIATANLAEAKGVKKKDVEYDLTASLLKAAEFRTSEEAITEVEIKRNGVYYFTLRIHPISDTEARRCRKKATTYQPNPQGRKLPPIEKEFDSAKFNSWIIYTATTDEDKQKIWNNPALKEKYDILDPVETVDVLLAVGEKVAIVDTVLDISGMDPDLEEVNPEEYAKN